MFAQQKSREKPSNMTFEYIYHEGWTNVRQKTRGMMTWRHRANGGRVTKSGSFDLRGDRQLKKALGAINSGPGV